LAFSFHTSEGSTSTPTGDHANLKIDAANRTFAYWGNGIAGINQSFQLKDFTNGSTNLVAFNEIRAGVSADDILGSWALGHIATSVTWGHGVNGDAYGPNILWARSDDIQGCATLHHTIGTEELSRLEMPCVSYLDENQNAGSRSRHAGGVNAAFLDGSVRFISNNIDPSLWHVIHSRETPGDVLFKDFDAELQWAGSVVDAQHSKRTAPAEAELTNSIGIKFVAVPLGKFTMGVPDVGNSTDTPSETPPHEVEITKPFLMAVTEVTDEQYRLIMETESFSTNEETVSGERVQLPIVDISWNDAAEFCRKLESIEAEKSAGRKYRLPTEAEWEYACRCGSSEPHRFSWSRNPNDNSGEAAGIQPALPLSLVASFPPNAFGLHDMRGNAWEWCSDWFDRDYYSRSPAVDPEGPDHGYIKVVRGSDWVYVGEGCFINYPMLAPWKKSPVTSFRVICE
jgi:prepilin-type processing-associated H-X9-DG protein